MTNLRCEEEPMYCTIQTKMKERAEVCTTYKFLEEALLLYMFVYEVQYLVV